MTARQFNVKVLNQLWCGHVTYEWTGKAWAYFSVVPDLFVRKLVGWATADNELTAFALKMAYESQRFWLVLDQYNVEQSISRRANC